MSLVTLKGLGKKRSPELSRYQTAAFFSAYVAVFSLSLDLSVCVLYLSFLGFIGFFSQENWRSNSTDSLQERFSQP